MNARGLDAKITDRSATLAVVGLGTIGLPLATFAAARGYRVIGLDIDRKRVAQINDRSVVYEYAELLADMPLERLEAMTDAPRLADADVLFFCVPTPVDDAGHIQLDRLAAAAASVGPHIRPGSLVVLESSVEVGTTRWFVERLRDAGAPVDSISFAYCPERYNPGLPTEEHAQVVLGRTVRLAGPHSYHRVPRVVGGMTPEAGQLAYAVYSSILEAPVMLVSTVEVAEAAKLMENIFRDVNIALVNEFAGALGALGVDTYEVIKAASTKSFAFLPHWPGLVGGECIPVDTWYLIRQAERVGVDCSLMRTAREVNDGVAVGIAATTLRMLDEANVSRKGAKVAILGTAYKPNVFDDRVSQSRVIARELERAGVTVRLCDPVVQIHNHRTRDALMELDDALQDADAAILATDHREFRAISPETLAKRLAHRIVVDVRNAWDHEALRRLGFLVHAWGRVP